MAGTSELIAEHLDLGRRPTAHLLRLVASWGLLADLSFADLLLFAPLDDESTEDPAGEQRDTRGGRRAERFVALGQVRPLTSQTLYRGDYIGTEVSAQERPNVARCWELGEIIDGERTHEGLRETVRELCIPVRCDGETVAVLTRERTPTVGRQPGELERSYIEIFNRLVRMVSTGEFPFPHVDGVGEAPRVGDGVLLLDGSARVAYASPNAVSALHRIGVHANTEGMRLSDLGLQESAVRRSFQRGVPASEEVERGAAVVLLHCLPLLDHGRTSGALVLLRDISELRRRDRLLVSKDATIREIHHRVKNNLQTISSLLRLQGRRLSSPEARTAIEESVRRIRSIALVHETLAHEAGDELAFDDIVRPLVRMVEEGLVGPESTVTFEVEGDAGMLPAAMATSLAVVLTELLQNAVDHAYPAGSGATGGRVCVQLANDGRHLLVSVTDDGVGLPEGFDLASATGLGLSIVRTLVTTELRGEMDMSSGDGPPPRPGTVARIVVPVEGDD